MTGRKWVRRLLAGAIGVLVLGFASSAAADEPCNGAVELCERTLDEVVLPGTHNSMSNEEDGWLLPNQFYAIPTQLDRGIRAMLIDTYYAKELENGNVAEVSRTDPDARMYLCHTLCQLGASDLINELARVADFLAANPREVLVFIIQDKLHPADLARAVEESGLIDHVYRGPADRFPTLGQMIARGERVVMLSEGGTGDVPWYHDGYAGPLQETPYNHLRAENGETLTVRGAVEQLTDPSTLDWTCRAFRGGESGALFLMNHWVNGELDGTNPVIPDPAVSSLLNTKEALVNRARACEARRGKLPTILAVDQFGDDGLIAAVNELNGVKEPEPPAGPLSRARLLLGKPRPARVIAGRPAIFRIVLQNRGDAASPAFRVCAQAPRRLVRRALTCRRVRLGAGTGRVLRLRIPTRPRARGRGPVRFTLLAPGGRLRTAAPLIVRPRYVRGR